MWLIRCLYLPLSQTIQDILYVPVSILVTLTGYDADKGRKNNSTDISFFAYMFGYFGHELTFIISVIGSLGVFALSGGILALNQKIPDWNKAAICLFTVAFFLLVIITWIIVEEYMDYKDRIGLR